MEHTVFSELDSNLAVLCFTAVVLYVIDRLSRKRGVGRSAG